MNSALNDSWPSALDYDQNGANTVDVADPSAKNDLISLVTSLENSVESSINDN